MRVVMLTRPGCNQCAMMHRIVGDLVETAAYQLPSAYVRQVAQSPSAAVCGMVALEVIAGRLTGVTPMLHKVDLRRRVSL